MPRPMRPAPTAAKRGSGARSFAIVQPLLELRRAQAGKAQAFESARARAQVAAEKTAADGKQSVCYGCVHARMECGGCQEGKPEFGVFGDVAVRMQVDVLAPVAGLDE